MYFGGVSTNSISNRQKATVLLNAILVCMNVGLISDEEIDEFLNVEIIDAGMTIGDLIDAFLKGLKGDKDEFGKFIKVCEQWKKEKKVEEL